MNFVYNLPCLLHQHQIHVPEAVHISRDDLLGLQHEVEFCQPWSWHLDYIQLSAEPRWCPVFRTLPSDEGG